MNDCSGLLKTSGELVEAVVSSDAAAAALETAQRAGGFVVKQAGKVVIGGLANRAIAKLFARLDAAKQSGEIDDGIESSDHGARLLQDALNALLDGLDPTQSEAVCNVFISLAKSDPVDGMERVLQLDVLEAATQLSPWEIILLHLLEGVSDEYYDAKHSTLDPNNRQHTRGIEQDRRYATSFNEVLKDHASDPDHRAALIAAVGRLKEKRISKFGGSDLINTRMSVFAIRKRPVTTTFGDKLVDHLYTGQEASTESSTA